MAFPTVGVLLNYVRQELNSELVGVDDTNALWKDDEIIEYIDQAQSEFSRATECLRDKSNFTLSVVSNTREYTYDPSILSIRGGWLETTGRRLQAMSLEDFDRSWLLGQDTVDRIGGWEEETGTPSHIIQDMEIDEVVLWPIPTTTETATLYVTKVADQVTATTDALEVPEQYRAGLTLRVMALAYLKHDTLETEDVNRSMMLGKKWESFLQDAVANISKRHGGS